MYIGVVIFSCIVSPAAIYLDLTDGHHQHALNHFGEISEIEGVVRLGWRGKQLGGDGVVHGRCRVNELGNL